MFFTHVCTNGLHRVRGNLVKAGLTMLHFLQEGSLPKISLPLHSRDQDQDMDSDQESLRNVRLERGTIKTRRHTLPPILPQTELYVTLYHSLLKCLPSLFNLYNCVLRDSNRVFKNTPHAQKMKSSSVMNPPPIHINGRHREVN